MTDPNTNPDPDTNPDHADPTDWFDGGQRNFVELEDGYLASMFARSDGSGPWLTLLHGFPTCSWDWHAVLPHLTDDRRTLTPDFLGCGDSDKPRGRPYTVDEQADVVEAIWALHAVETTGVLAHGYGAVVAQELLARRAREDLPVDLQGCTFLNAPLYHDVAGELPGGELLRAPFIGPVLTSFVTEGLFRRGFTRLFSETHPPTEAELDGHWAALTRRGGKGVAHRLLRYTQECENRADRWTGALEETAVPCRFVWGLADPVAGASVAEAIRERVPDPDVVELADVGHYPHLEVPERVATEQLASTTGSDG